MNFSPKTILLVLLVPKRYNTWGSNEPPAPEKPLISLRGFSGAGGSNHMTPKCYTFLESGGQAELISKERKINFAKLKEEIYHLISLRGFSGAGGTKHLTPKCDTFLVSGGLA